MSPPLRDDEVRKPRTAASKSGPCAKATAERTASLSGRVFLDLDTGFSNGEVGDEQFYGIVIADGEHGIDYNFTERWE
jgi:hypothetical protein